jgi:hypothetical protein
MTLILKTMKKALGGQDAKDDYVVLDGESLLVASTRSPVKPDGFGQ